MRIALLSSQWPGIRMGGIGSYVRQCAAALASARHEPHVFTFELPGDLRSSIPHGVVVHEMADLATRVQRGMLSSQAAAAINIGGEGVYRLAMGWILSAAMLEVHRDHPFDVVEGPDVDALALPLLLTPGADLPVITHLHCCTGIAQQVNGPNVPVDSSIIAMELAAIHMADALCAPTSAVVELTRSLIPIARDVAIIPHPFVCGDEPFVEPPADGPIVFIGRIERLKGVETIADALNLFLPRNPDAQFVFVGPDTNTADGRSMRQFIAARIRPQLTSRVEFTGELPPAAVRARISASRFVVLPSLRENFSLACCEAMAAGRALIVSSNTGSVELIGDAGIVAARGCASSLAEAMEKLHRDRRLLVDLSRRAYGHARDAFDPHRIASLKADVYARIASHFDPRDRAQRLATLPASCSAVLLPALSALVGGLTASHHAQLNTPGRRLLGIMQKLQQHSGRPSQIFLYGAGKHTARLMSESHLWESAGHRVVGLIDDHPRFCENPVCLGLPVQSLKAVQTALTAGICTPPVVLSTDTYEDQFWQQTAPLRDAGVPVFRLYSSMEQWNPADMNNVKAIGR